MTIAEIWADEEIAKPCLVINEMDTIVWLTTKESEAFYSGRLATVERGGVRSLSTLILLPAAGEWSVL